MGSFFPEDLSLHPEVKADIKATERASKESKQAILDTVEEIFKANPDKVTAFDEIRAISLEDVHDESIIDTMLFRTPGSDGVILIIGDSQTAEHEGKKLKKETRYSFKAAPDDLEIEITHRLQEYTAGKSDETLAQWFKRTYPMWGEQEEKDKAIQEERELGLTFFSERDAQNLARKLRRAIPQKDRSTPGTS